MLLANLAIEAVWEEIEVPARSQESSDGNVNLLWYNENGKNILNPQTIQEM